MKTLTVSLPGRDYNIKIERALLDRAGEECRAVMPKATKLAVVTDSNVAPLYACRVLESLSWSGFEAKLFTVPAGEASKCKERLGELWEGFLEFGLTRADGVVALGGGVVGDLAGFAAACFLRGIRFIQFPTTLLAAVDSSVGGKTAIDLASGKNLAGAFYQPSLVLCDIDTLNTLPEDVFRDGCAEVIKYAILYDPDLFATLRRDGLRFDREAVISRCVELKRDVVNADEFDTGARQKLNLGHTIGHGVEALSNFTLSHGKAVAIGTAIVTRASHCFGICDQETVDAVVDILYQFGLPVNTEFTAKQLQECALSDKKRSGGTVNLIVPEAIGRCAIRPTVVTELESFLQAGL